MRTIGIVVIICVNAIMADVSDAQEIRSERDGWDYVETVQRNYIMQPTGTLIISAELGTIEVSSWAKDEVDVQVRKQLWGMSERRARRLFAEIEVEILHVDNEVRIKVERIQDNETRWFWQDWIADVVDRVSVDVNVQVPVGLSLDLKSVSGDIRTEIDEGNITARTLNGMINIGPTLGDIKANSTSGNIKTKRVKGNVQVKSLSGEITIGPTQGEVKANTTSGDIETGSVQRNVQVKSLSGNIVVGPAQEDVTANTTSGNIETGKVQRNVQVKSLSGNIVVGPAQGDVTANTTSGNIKTKRVKGNVEVKSLSGDIMIGPTQGEVKANTTSGNIEH